MAYGGRYKGMKFRSLLELSLLIQFEGDGLVLGTDVLYEAVKIPYGNVRKKLGRKRNYIVDFLVPSRKWLIEVKPTHRVETKYFKAKRRAAQDYAVSHDLAYIIVTEDALKGHVLTLAEAERVYGGPQLSWDRRAWRALSRKKKRKR